MLNLHERMSETAPFFLLDALVLFLPCLSFSITRSFWQGIIRSLRSKRFQSSYCAKVRAGHFPSPPPPPRPFFFFFCSRPNFLDELARKRLLRRLDYSLSVSVKKGSRGRENTTNFATVCVLGIRFSVRTGIACACGRRLVEGLQSCLECAGVYRERKDAITQTFFSNYQHTSHAI